MKTRWGEGQIVIQGLLKEKVLLLSQPKSEGGEIAPLTPLFLRLRLDAKGRGAMCRYNQKTLLLLAQIVQIYFEETFKFSTLKILNTSHCEFIRLNPKKKGPFQLCLPALLGIRRNSKQEEICSFTEGFLI